jgi:hypothetical protein
MAEVRLIDANDLLKHLKVTSITTESKKETMQYFISGIRQCLNKLVIPTIEKAPTIEPEKAFPEWRNPETDPPKVEEEVLIMYQTASGECGITTAHYEDGTLLSQDSIFYWDELAAWGKLDEEHDDYIIPKGWWEYRHFNQDEVYNNRVDYPVVGWMPLPPKEGKK